MATAAVFPRGPFVKNGWLPPLLYPERLVPARSVALIGEEALSLKCVILRFSLLTDIPDTSPGADSSPTS